MPQHEQLLPDFYNTSQICDEGNCPNIAAAVTMTLDHGRFEDETLLGSSPDMMLAEPAEPTYSEMDEWQSKAVKNWTKQDVVLWVNSVARYLNICCTEMPSEKFAKFNGVQLLSQSKLDFIQLDNTHGATLYQKLHEKLAAENPSNYHQLNNARYFMYDESEETVDDKKKVHDMMVAGYENRKEESLYRSTAISENNVESGDIGNSAEVSTPVAPPKKKGPGRPKGSKRKKKPEKLGRLWEFLRDLLKNREYCPSLIVWDNYEEGMFRFVHSDKVAKLWGTKKDNPDMNYEKLSRAMRYYYKSQVLQPVIGRRLVYKFGPNARDWRVDNPNFRN
ncbi:hypothetical protein O3M35_004521 [Rhynocoris fuscipes]|uniref:ETS domain-containing protein n=1 Tax=Rhynocoris fuscipes TaxID=488301 RepID=A0AAW1CGV8_9HEMI